jgi:putative FmdB family regulatory protein
MPIYEYRCGSCGLEKEYLQKVNDAPVAVCPACGSDSFAKLISAAGFQLKGSGWYVTDFKNGSKPKSEPKSDPKSQPKPEAGESAGAAGSSPASSSPPTSASACPACTTD